MESKGKTAFTRLKNSGAKEVLAEFLRERLADKQKAFTACSRDTFEVHKGRCLELNDMLNELLN